MWRYAVLYFLLLIVFLALLVGPIVAGSKILTPGLIKNIPMDLFQPINQNNNDTLNDTATGTAALSTGGAEATGNSNKVRLF